MSIHAFDQVSVSRHGFCRRRFMKTVSTVSLTAGALSFGELMATGAEELRKRGKSMILLWMQGGPSQFETLDPKPGKSTGGPTEAIQTAVAGIQIAENLPQIARQMSDIAIIRSMTNKEGSHPRASYQMHTGYAPSGSVKHPSIGACIASQIGDAAAELPSFVSIGTGGPGGAIPGAGFLGMDYEPFAVAQPGRLPENIAMSVSKDRFHRRTALMEKLSGEFATSTSAVLADTHQSLYGKASRLVLTPETEAFDISAEPQSLQADYGQSNFGKGCLLARRLVERGVTFVEVRSGNWDTHQDNFEQCARNAGEVDPATATLIRDLNERGMLKDTLIVWMGEFGRTPKINPREGRDHYPRVFSIMMAGCGVQGGQVYGASTGDGSEIADHPVNVADLFQTICKALDVNAAHENMSPLGRPMKIVDGGRVLPVLS
ncbi:MAG: DUF1501 domain-containing protein [Planctomycetaceae bacterium]|nr:DUF1501 domain-containing protein [Planctomycetaceae bacterium]